MSTIQLKVLSITINDTIILKFSHIPNIHKGDLLCIKGKYFPLQCKEIYLDQCHALNSYDIFVPIAIFMRRVKKKDPPLLLQPPVSPHLTLGDVTRQPEFRV